MAYRVRFTEPAKRDLREITTCLRQQAGDPVAKRIIEELIAKAESLQKMPTRQRERRNLGAEIRSVSLRAYMMFYRVVDQTVFILRIVPGSREITAEMLR